MVWLFFEKSIKLIKSGSAELDTGLCSEGSFADGMLPLCKLSPDVLGFRKKLNKEQERKTGRKKEIKSLKKNPFLSKWFIYIIFECGKYFNTFLLVYVTLNCFWIMTIERSSLNCKKKKILEPRLAKWVNRLAMKDWGPELDPWILKWKGKINSRGCWPAISTHTPLYAHMKQRPIPTILIF